MKVFFIISAYLVMPCLSLTGQAVYNIESETVCWNGDSTIQRIMIMSSRTPDFPSIMGYTDASGANITVVGGTQTLGSCGGSSQAPTISSLSSTQNGCNLEILAILTNTQNAGQITVTLGGVPVPFFFDVSANVVTAQYTSPGGTLTLIVSVITSSGTTSSSLVIIC